MSKAFPIPVRAEMPAFGPGSQPAQDDALAVLPLPREVNTFEMPHVPERVGAAVMRESLATLQRMLDALDAVEGVVAGDAPGPCVSLDTLSPAALAVTNEVLGEGEVSIRIAAEGSSPARHAQESVFAGLWRCAELDAQGGLTRYWLEAGPIPAAVLAAARADELTPAAAPAEASGPAPGDASLLDPAAWPTGAMNSPALLAELRGRVAAHRRGEHGGQINLSLLPLSPADHEVLAQALPAGPVAIISRGFGNCHVGSTSVPGVWRQQYFNSRNTLILELVEVTRLPEVATASPEDLQDSRERLAELIRWMRESAQAEDAQPAH
jgi:hydrogenase-1 operon protein HyaF